MIPSILPFHPCFNRKHSFFACSQFTSFLDSEQRIIASKVIKRFFLHSKKTAFVISTSYGYQEADLTPSYMQRQCAEYGKLSLTGMTFVYSSGDSGVAGFDNLCLDDEGNQIPGVNGTRFNPSFPGGCPYVTSVGATQVVPGHKVTDPESAVFQRFPSGGGFSNIFPRPSYQDAAVSGYLEKYPPPYAAGVFNATGSAFPDVSANGLNYSVVIDGQFRLVSGTSASAPTFASILSAINDARLAVGKNPVGWVNPAVSILFHQYRCMRLTSMGLALPPSYL